MQITQPRLIDPQPHRAGLLRERLRKCGETFQVEVNNMKTLFRYGEALRQNLQKQDTELQDMLKKAVASLEGVQMVCSELPAT